MKRNENNDDDVEKSNSVPKEISLKLYDVCET